MTTTPPFQKRFLSVDITVPSGTQKIDSRTGQSQASTLAGQTVTLKNYRITADVECYGSAAGIKATIEIYNLPKSLIAALSGYGTNGVFDYRSQSDAQISSGQGTVGVTLYAGTDTQSTLGSSVVFQGSLLNAQVMMQAIPDPFLEIVAHTTGFARLTAGDVISFKGAATASSIARQIADRMGWAFEDGGVTSVLQNPYFWGSVGQQLTDLALQGRFQYAVDRGTLAIWPIGQARNGSGTGFTISASNGLIGYPSFNGIGVEFLTLYRPEIRLGDSVTLVSDSPNSSGTYHVYDVAHHLSCEQPGGPWETRVMASFLPNPTGLSGVSGT